MRYKLLLILLTFPLFLFAQKLEEDKRTFQGSFFLGLNPSQVDGDELSGFRQFGLSVGPSVAFRLKNRFFFNMELLYSAVGSAWHPDQNLYPNQNYDLKLRYVAIPMYVNYHDKDGKVRLGAGLSYGRLFSAHETIDFYKVDIINPEFHKSDLTLFGDLQYLFNKHIGLNLRFSNSLLYIRYIPTTRYAGFGYSSGPSDGLYQYNKFITVRGFYVF